jgi:hypothetical protein
LVWGGIPVGMRISDVGVGGVVKVGVDSALPQAASNITNNSVTLKSFV